MPPFTEAALTFPAASQFNLAAPVQDLYTYVASATPGAEFDLVTTYPRATLSDKAVTLEGEGHGGGGHGVHARVQVCRVG
eukprot:2153981-Rhodomonas_salina.2